MPWKSLKHALLFNAVGKLILSVAPPGIAAPKPAAAAIAWVASAVACLEPLFFDAALRCDGPAACAWAALSHLV